MNKILNILISLDFWRNLIKEIKLKKVLKIFFSSEDQELQDLFYKNFYYPTDMTVDPVRYNVKDNSIYYIINFQSKELYENEHTVQAAIFQSMSILQNNLPLGTTEYIAPEIEGRIEDTFSLLISAKYEVQYLKYSKILFHLFKIIFIKLLLAASLYMIV